jgi:hypothetical protein
MIATLNASTGEKYNMATKTSPKVVFDNSTFKLNQSIFRSLRNMGENTIFVIVFLMSNSLCWP